MAIYCPGCGAEAAKEQQYCRKCGVNLFLVGKALTLGESIARGDRGPLPKVKAMMESFKLDHVSEEVGRNLEQMNREIVESLDSPSAMGVQIHRDWGTKRKEKTTQKLEPSPEQAHAQLVHQGAGSLFSGVAIMIVLYALASTIILKIPPEQAARIPFELEPVIRMAWIVGLVPALAGFGQLIAAAFTRPRLGAAPEPPRLAEPEQQPLPDYRAPYAEPGSVTEHTTEFLNAGRQRETE